MGKQAEAPKNQVLFVASQDDFEPMARIWLKDFTDLVYLPSPPLEILVEGAPAGMEPKLILLDGRGDPQKTLEWAQTLKMAFPVPLVVFYDSSSQLEFAILKKNGADSLLHLYYDSEFIVDKLLSLVNWDDGGDPPLGMLNALAAEDLSVDVDLNFDVYVHLPGNQKSILVRRKGTNLDQKLIDKVTSSHQNVYFKKSEMKQFMEYSRTLMSFKNSELSGVTDKIIRTRQRIHEIVSQFFDQESSDFKSGRLVLENCEKIIDEFDIKKWNSPAMAVRNVVLFTGRTRTYYNDVMTLCVIAAGLGYLLDKKPEEINELALAGLLHNVGLAFLKNPQVAPILDKLNAADKEQYLKYPELTVNKIKTKKVPLPATVSELILQHREKVSGGGFPKASTSDFHHPLSRILQLAFILMELTQLENNMPRFTLKAALNHLQDEMMKGNTLVDGTILLMVKKKIDSIA